LGYLQNIDSVNIYTAKMKNFLTLVTLFGVASAQSVASVDPATQIAFQSWSNPNGFKVGLALPEADGTDLIAQIVRRIQ
jgi:hypothetical protein